MLQYNTIFLAKNLLFTRQKKLNLEFKKKCKQRPYYLAKSQNGK